MSYTDQMLADSSMCSLIAHGDQSDPIGTASGRHDRHIFVETPLPWSRDVVQSASFPSSLIELQERSEEQGRPMRLLAIAPDDAYSVDGHAHRHPARKTG